MSDIGALNQKAVLRGFETSADLGVERERTQRSADPLGCGTLLQRLGLQSYRLFSWMKPVLPSAESGVIRPVYEIRTYGVKVGGLQPPD